MHFLTVFAILLGAASTTQIGTPELQSATLRILPLGASITWGQASSDGNGYREKLRDLLSPNNLTYVGTQCSGDMFNGNNEGHPGFTISQMQSVAAPDMPYKPNVVLIYVGTNDMKGFANPSEAPENMMKLVAYLIENLPTSLIVVSKLFLNANATVQRRIETFNSAISGLDMLGNVVIADMSSALLASDLSSDGTHPNDDGYAKVASVFHATLIAAGSRGDIPIPSASSELSKLKVCDGAKPQGKGLVKPTDSPSSSVPSAYPAAGTGVEAPQQQTKAIAAVSSPTSKTSASASTTHAIPTTIAKAAKQTTSLVQAQGSNLSKSSTASTTSHPLSQESSSIAVKIRATGSSRASPCAATASKLTVAFSPSTSSIYTNTTTTKTTVLASSPASSSPSSPNTTTSVIGTTIGTSIGSGTETLAASAAFTNTTSPSVYPSPSPSSAGASSSSETGPSSGTGNSTGSGNASVSVSAPVSEGPAANAGAGLDAGVGLPSSASSFTSFKVRGAMGGVVWGSLLGCLVAVVGGAGGFF